MGQKVYSQTELMWGLQLLKDKDVSAQMEVHYYILIIKGC